jgi:hypothetical protein
MAKRMDLAPAGVFQSSSVGNSAVRAMNARPAVVLAAYAARPRTSDEPGVARLVGEDAERADPRVARRHGDEWCRRLGRRFPPGARHARRAVGELAQHADVAVALGDEEHAVAPVGRDEPQAAKVEIPMRGHVRGNPLRQPGRDGVARLPRTREDRERLRREIVGRTHVHASGCRRAPTGARENDDDHTKRRDDERGENKFPHHEYPTQAVALVLAKPLIVCWTPV